MAVTDRNDSTLAAVLLTAVFTYHKVLAPVVTASYMLFLHSHGMPCTSCLSEYLDELVHKHTSMQDG